jgi:starch phosphorylase
MSGTRFTLEVQPRIPATLRRLEDLANDLFYSWDRQVRRLFTRLDQDLWGSCGHNPKTFLRRVSQQRLEEVASDRVFMEDFQRVLSAYEVYQQQSMRPGLEESLNPENDLVAYFCAEFGLHESLPIYSGGLGILAGDHCKAASDLCIPFVAVGILYRQGYFNQTIDEHGNQVSHYAPSDFNDLAITQAVDDNGKPLVIDIDFPGRKVYLRVWRARVGHISLYLLDSDLQQNQEHDRIITHQLYGGDQNMPARCGRLASSRLSGISTKAIPHSRSWSAAGNVYRKGTLLQQRWKWSRPARYSPRTPRLPPATIFSIMT